MTRALRLLLLLLLTPPGVLAATGISGVIRNGTTGKPQAGVEVVLMKLEGGMATVGQATTDTEGRFRFDAPPPTGELHYLLRAEYRGVGYHAAPRPAEQGQDLRADMEVYESTTERSAVRTTRHQVIVEPRPGRLLVAESYTLANEGAPRRTYMGASATNKETFRFILPEGRAEELSVLVSGPRQMPVRQNATRRGEAEYAIEYPLRPGETRVDVNYRLPYESAFTFRKKGGNPSGSAAETAIIAPLEAVTLSGTGLTPANRDESRGAALYSWNSKGPLQFDIAGVLPEARPEAGPGGAEGESTTVENPNYVFLVRWKILVVLGVFLALGLAHLYRLGLTARSIGRSVARSAAGARK